jgi:rod shape-determining protein MreD
MWRDHWLDWSIACAAILFCAIGQWAVGCFVSGGGAPSTMALPLILAILSFPPIARLCARLDRWRLAR